MRDIAKAAGVSAQTVYDSVGSKQQLVAQLNDLIDTEAGIGAIVGADLQSEDPQVVAAISARVARSILEHCGDIIHALVTGAAAEPELAAVLAEGQRRHVAGATTVVGRLEGARRAGRPRSGRDARGRLRRALRPRAAGELRLVAGPARALDDRHQHHAPAARLAPR